MAEMLDVVNQNDEVIGKAARDEVHQKGLTCRMIYVWFYTPDKKIILQRRSKTKKNHPGRLTTAVSGHVESGATYREAALREAFEETGIKIIANDLIEGGIVHARYDDEASEGYISDGMRASFLYKFIGQFADLKIEDGEGAGFELWEVDALLDNSFADGAFVPFVSGPYGRAVLEKIRSL
jgi:isopentenyl-diphosphate Delta-isomerase